MVFIFISGGSIFLPESNPLISKSWNRLFFPESTQQLVPKTEIIFNSFTEVIIEIQNTVFQLFKVYHMMSSDKHVHPWLGDKHIHHLQKSFSAPLDFFLSFFFFVVVVVVVSFYCDENTWYEIYPLNAFLNVQDNIVNYRHDITQQIL